MLKPVYIAYQNGQDVIKLLDAARMKHGESVKLILIPAPLWHRIKP